MSVEHTAQVGLREAASGASIEKVVAFLAVLRKCQTQRTQPQSPEYIFVLNLLMCLH